MPKLVADLERLLDNYTKVRKLKTGAEKQENLYKAALLEGLESLPADENGQVIYRLDEPLEGWDDKPVWGAKREKRVSPVLDEDAAMALIEKYELQDSCLETITVLNEDALLAANFNDVIPDEEFKTLYSDKVTYAFVPVRSA